LSRLIATTRGQDRLVYSRQRDYIPSNGNFLPRVRADCSTV
jgi:hypothetical protein